MQDDRNQPGESHNQVLDRSVTKEKDKTREIFSAVSDDQIALLFHELKESGALSICDGATWSESFSMLLACEIDRYLSTRAQIMSRRLLGNTDVRNGEIVQQRDFSAVTRVPGAIARRIMLTWFGRRASGISAVIDLDEARFRLWKLRNSSTQTGPRNFESIAESFSRLDTIYDENRKFGPETANLMLMVAGAKMSERRIHALRILVKNVVDRNSGQKRDILFALCLDPRWMTSLRNRIQGMLDLFENLVNPPRKVSLDEMFSPKVRLTRLSIHFRLDSRKNQQR
jgi:hypothetical protein